MAESDLTTSGETAYSESDSGWKEVIELYFKQFVSFFFPAIYDEVDLEKGYQFLDSLPDTFFSIPVINRECTRIDANKFF
ncbi:MAG: hypothetical protein AB1611_02335 [bacterium]